MDERKHLILLNGENKTRDIQFCTYNPQAKKFDVTFNGGGRTYTYNHSSVEWRKDPKALNPNLHHISIDGTPLSDIHAIFSFSGSPEYWHIVYGNSRSVTCPRHKLEVETSCLDEETSKNRLNYLRDIAAINGLKSEDGEVLLKKQYEKLTFVDKSSVLALYLNPEEHKIRSHKREPLIFPFGGNASQFQAVEYALEKQLSVIQGPPGTGKTQTILNIIANLLIRGKTIQVVSNNNSATENVLEKLSSPKYGLGFLVAALGKKENKQAFIANQTGTYPDISAWEKTQESLRALKSTVTILSGELSNHFVKQERLASAKRELSALELEVRYFDQYYAESEMVRPAKRPSKRLSSAQILRFLQNYESISESGKSLPLLLKLKTAFLYGLCEWKFLQNDISAVLAHLQNLFYRTKQEELTAEIDELQRHLATADVQRKMNELTSLSLEYLRAVLFERYGDKPRRDRFTDESLWQNPHGVLKEYPIVLSTAFSSRSSLKGVTYDYIIMDEASQVDVATGALTLSCAKNAVIVGDLKQLPNVVDEDSRKISDAIFTSYNLPAGYSCSDNSFLKSICSVIDDVPQTLLREHYRCHPKIIHFCNQKFYDNELVIMTEDKGEADTLSVYRTIAGDHRRGHINQRQIDVTIREVFPTLSGTSPEDIGIIAPYRAQVNTFAAAIADTGIEVDTVHKFQGREKDAIILTTVDDEVTDFSDDPYLLNVAISRAKKRLCLVVSGNEQPADSNIRDLVSYIEYSNFSVVNSKIYSVFDLLYQQYTEERIAFLAKHRKISEYDSENIMYGAIVELLREHTDMPLSVICHQKVCMLIRNFDGLTEDERRYASHPNTHVDFLVYNRITKEPVLAVEVDGFHYHKDGTAQAERDRLKDSIFSKCGIRLLRLPTNGSGEIEKIRRALVG